MRQIIVQFTGLLVVLLLILSFPLRATSQITATDSLEIIRAVVQTRFQWIDGELQFQSCRVFEHAARPADLGVAFGPQALDYVEDPCRERAREYPLALIEGLEDSGDSVMVRVLANGFENVHREVYVVRRREGTGTGWFVDEVRTSGFLRLQRP